MLHICLQKPTGTSNDLALAQKHNHFKNHFFLFLNRLCLSVQIGRNVNKASQQQDTKLCKPNSEKFSYEISFGACINSCELMIKILFALFIFLWGRYSLWMSIESWMNLIKIDIKIWKSFRHNLYQFWIYNGLFLQTQKNA